MRPTRALIDMDALRRNLARVREAAPSRRVIAIIKADGYGHGLCRVASALEEADAFGVACVEEASLLRAAGVEKRILLLEGFFSAEELSTIARLRLDLVVHNKEQLRQLLDASLDWPAAIWLKIDTGMHRLGFPPEEAREAWYRLAGNHNVAGPVRVFTHLACADDPSDNRTPQQMACFRDALEGVDAETSAANSAGILSWQETHGDWVRPGIMLYGVSPFMEGTGADHGLSPVMTLSTALLAVNRCRRGDAVGYGATYVCPEDMPVGVAAIGYGDGYPRHAPAGTPVLLNGRRVPLIGRVSMDMITLDLRDQPDARSGDPVTLWGLGLPVEEIARQAGTIAYELLCGVTPRVVREAVGSSQLAAASGQGIARRSAGGKKGAIRSGRRAPGGRKGAGRSK